MTGAAGLQCYFSLNFSGNIFLKYPSPPCSSQMSQSPIIHRYRIWFWTCISPHDAQWILYIPTGLIAEQSPGCVHNPWITEPNIQAVVMLPLWKSCSICPTSLRHPFPFKYVSSKYSSFKVIIVNSSITFGQCTSYHRNLCIAFCLVMTTLVFWSLDLILLPLVMDTVITGKIFSSKSFQFCHHNHVCSQS